MEKVLFIVAHPDDAELAAGGSIKKFTSEGSIVRVVNLTISENTEHTRRCRTEAAGKAASMLGYELEWYNNGMHNQVEEVSIHKLVTYIDSVIAAFQPTQLFTHWDGDSHYDHVLTSRAVMASTRKWKGNLYFLPPNEVRTTRFTDFCPNAFVDIGDHAEAKWEALSAYNSFTGNIFRPLNIENFKIINRYFGITAGCSFAEAFLIKKQTLFFHPIHHEHTTHR